MPRRRRGQLGHHDLYGQWYPAPWYVRLLHWCFKSR